MEFSKLSNLNFISLSVWMPQISLHLILQLPEQFMHYCQDSFEIMLCAKELMRMLPAQS